MTRKAGQIISRGQSTRLVRVDLGRDPQTGTRKYHNSLFMIFPRGSAFAQSETVAGDNGRVARGLRCASLESAYRELCD